MEKFDIRSIIFSSSATVYGNVDKEIIDENTLPAPLNPYGKSKVMMETMIHDLSLVSKISYIALRYFNVAGAKKDGTLGEMRPRLIPTILKVAQNRNEIMEIYGLDYNTPDGTCIRDYIHVLDLVRAHLMAFKYLQNGGKSDICNIGSSKGFSNLEVLRAASKVTGEEIPVEMISSVIGDASILVAASKKIESQLGWKPIYNDIEEIISDSWRFQLKFPNGYQ